MSDIEKLNRFTRTPLSEEEVYCFDVILCDNDIDRDMERFSEKALGELQELFVGKTGIFDHDLKSGGQTARIYDTELVRDNIRKTRDGRPYVALKAHAYMVRTDSNADLIREIEGGIKKEVSVSCSAGKRSCSVCGADRSAGGCTHIPGRVYGDMACCTVLEDMQDAYEWSFVAVPAQVAAGVTKHFVQEQTAAQEDVLGEVEAMLRAEVISLCGRENAVSKALCIAAGKMDLRELMQFKKSLLQEHSGDVEVQLLGGEQDDAQLPFQMSGGLH